MNILLILLLISSLVTASHGQQDLPPNEIQLAEQNLLQVLAAPNERAFLQVLTEVRILRDTSIDTATIYDLVVRFDPDRFRNPRVGRYPLSFENQLILWGKRISLYTRSTSWTSGRFYLHDISTAEEAWISTEDLRSLYQPATKKLPVSFRGWLKLIHSADPRTDLRTMSRWLRMMHKESRDQVTRRLQAENQKNSTTP